MAFDFKREYREFYMPKDQPEIIHVPPMNYIAVRGQGNPNTEDGASAGHRDSVRGGLYAENEL